MLQAEGALELVVLVDQVEVDRLDRFGWTPPGSTHHTWDQIPCSAPSPLPCLLTNFAPEARARGEGER